MSSHASSTKNITDREADEIEEGSLKVHLKPHNIHLGTQKVLGKQALGDGADEHE